MEPSWDSPLRAPPLAIFALESFTLGEPIYLENHRQKNTRSDIPLTTVVAAKMSSAKSLGGKRAPALTLTYTDTDRQSLALS